MWKAALAGALASLLVVAAALSFGCGSVLAPGMCQGNPPAQASTVKKPERHAFYVAQGVPEPYRSERNPLKRSVGNLIEGARLYDLRCAACHGTLGTGDGEAGDQLVVAPADLSESLADPAHHDDYFYWTISEGGAPFGSDMPRFKGDLTDRQMWTIVVFLRAVIDDRDAPDGIDPTAP